MHCSLKIPEKYRASDFAQPARPYEQPSLSTATRIVHFWKKYLRLDDWDLTVEIGSLPPGTLGMCSAYDRIKRAVITVPPEHFQRWCEAGWAMPGQTAAQALEWTIVHELVHIYGYPHRNELMHLFEGEGDSGKEAL